MSALVSKNGHRKTMQQIRMRMRRLQQRMRRLQQFSQFIWSSIRVKPTIFVLFHDEPRVQQRQQVKDKPSYIPRPAAGNTSPDMKQYSLQRKYGRFIEIKSNPRRRKLMKWIKAPYFVEAVLAIETMREPQSRGKYKPSTLKGDSS